MSSEIELSVLIPVYGVEKYIERCAVSLFDQTLKKNIEYIFVDDCSPDNSIQLLNNILEKYPERKEHVRIIRLTTNSGSAVARKIASEEARGKYIIACDSDDWVEPVMYECMLSRARETQADIVICHYYVNYRRTQKAVTEKYNANPRLLLNQLIRGEIHNGLWNKMIRRELYNELNPSFVTGLNMWEDVSVILRMVYNAKSIAIVPLPLYHYSQINSNAYTQHWRSEYTESICQATDINITFFCSKNVVITPLVHRALYSCLVHGKKQERQKLLKKYGEKGALKGVDYSIFSKFGGVVARLLFNGHFIIADMLVAIKRLITKVVR